MVNSRCRAVRTVIIGALALYLLLGAGVAGAEEADPVIPATPSPGAAQQEPTAPPDPAHPDPSPQQVPEPTAPMPVQMPADAPPAPPKPPAGPGPVDAQAAAAAAGAAEYVPLDPARIVDTRRGLGVAGRLPQEAARGFMVRGLAGIASDASAVVLHATATEAAGPGWLVLYPCATAMPLASSVNFSTSQPVANQVTVALRAGTPLGEVCAYSSVAVHLVVDVAGYYPAGSTYRPVGPRRMADTRPGTPAPGAKGRIAGDAGVLRVQIAGTDGVPAGARTAVVNLTVTGPEQPGFITLYPCGTERPVASMLNYAAWQTIANAATTRLGDGGAVCIFSSRPTHVVVDLSGWFPADSPVSTRIPVRLADTRPAATSGWHKGAITAQQVLEVPVVGVAEVPNGATAALLNLTVVSPTTRGWALVYPCQATPPLASHVNFGAGATVAASVTAVISPRGTVCVTASATTHLIVDLVGHHPGPARLPASGSTFFKAEGVSQVFAAEPNGSVLPVSAEQLAALGNPVPTVYRNPPGTRYERAAWSLAAVFAVDPAGTPRRIARNEWIALLAPPIRTVPMVTGSSVQKTANSPTLYVVAPDGQYAQLSEADYRAMGSPDVVVVIAAPGSRFVRTERNATVYALAPDGTTRALSAAEFAQIGSPAVETLAWRPVLRSVTASDLWASYRAGCPVGPASLVRLEVPYWDFAGRLQSGAIVVARTVSGTIEATLRSAFDAHFPLQQITPIEQYRGVDEASMAAGNTSAFNCRPVVGNPSRLSQHSYGNAIDVNPAQNPYVTASAVYPPGSRTYLDRNWRRPGMLYAGDPIVGPLTGAGWWWGARWSLPDYQHFSSNGG